MNYELLTEAEMNAIARERVRYLEGEHFRWRMILAEAVAPSDVAEASAMIADVERRIGMHVVHETADDAATEEPRSADTSPNAPST